nr:MAG TPA: protein of unknown function (DUF5445) [Caudoviricetes sp.]
MITRYRITIIRTENQVFFREKRFLMMKADIF